MFCPSPFFAALIKVCAQVGAIVSLTTSGISLRVSNRHAMIAIAQLSGLGFHFYTDKRYLRELAEAATDSEYYRQGITQRCFPWFRREIFPQNTEFWERILKLPAYFPETLQRNQPCLILAGKKFIRSNIWEKWSIYLYSKLVAFH